VPPAGRLLADPIHAPNLAYANAVSEIEDLMASTVPDGVVESVKDFMMGAVSGAIASFSVFPIDLAKTRMQDQRVVAGAEMLYKNTFQTLKKVIAEEGFPAIYGGVVPVVIGSAPEAALQLGGDVAARKFFSEKLGMGPNEQLPIWAEITSGAFAGISQVLASNPMERVKILQQVGAKGGVLQIGKTLGIRGLYQGWYATALRDVPFGAIYFTTYSRVKRALIDASKRSVKKDKRGKIIGGSKIPDDHFIFSLVAGLVAGVPGAGLTVPSDVIKTRMQSTGLGLHASAGGTVPLPSLRSTVKALYNEGGVGAFFKGAAPRVGRVAPQLAICVVIFEGLKVLMPPKPIEAKGKGKGKGKGKK